jgi:hypothetical protein
MSIGSGIAVAGWFIAFVMACQTSENTVAGVVFFGIMFLIVTRLAKGVPLIEITEKHTDRQNEKGS